MEPPETSEEKVLMDTHGVWGSSDIAHQLRVLGNVEVEITTLLHLAASATKLLSLPPLPTEHAEADGEDSVIPGKLTRKEDMAIGEERSELFVEKAKQYFDTLDSIQHSLRRSLYDLRLKRISPSSIDAPPAGFVPKPLGVGPPKADGADGERQGLQETRVEQSAWLGVLSDLRALKNGKGHSDVSESHDGAIS